MSEVAGRFDVIVVGAGAAGLYTALCLRQRGLAVALLTKEALNLSHSADSASKWAQGGIAAALDPQDAPSLHAEDTLRAGVGLCEQVAVSVLVHEAPKAIQQLEAWGVRFDRKPDQTLAMTLEAAHSRQRVLHVADATGKALVTALKAQVLEDAGITAMPHTLVLDLLLHQDRCAGVLCAMSDGSLQTLLSKAVVLATGGYAHLFAQTTNPPASTGDGVAIAWRAGAWVRDLEFVQFHPTALAVAGAPRFLISEAVRGEGAHLIDSAGDRFASKYHPQGELAPRDVVSRAIFHHLQHTGDSTVFLDLSPIPSDRIRYRFPNIIKVCEQWGIDLLHQPIPVTPAAHYCMGGIATDIWGETSITGLYAVGETASTGVHGANRLASNSLLECFVFAERISQKLGDQGQYCPPVENLDPIGNYSGAVSDRDCNQLTQALRSLCWRNMGITRDAVHLQQAKQQIADWRRAWLTALPIQRQAMEYRNLLDVAWLMVQSALFRTESRGAHYRADYPHSDPQWLCHSTFQGDRLFAQPLDLAYDPAQS